MNDIPADLIDGHEILCFPGLPCKTSSNQQLESNGSSSSNSSSRSEACLLESRWAEKVHLPFPAHHRCIRNVIPQDRQKAAKLGK